MSNRRNFIRKSGLLGVHDSQRIARDYVFTTEDRMQRRLFDDEIGRNCYDIDVQFLRKRMKEGGAYFL